MVLKNHFVTAYFLLGKTEAIRNDVVKASHYKRRIRLAES